MAAFRVLASWRSAIFVVAVAGWVCPVSTDGADVTVSSPEPTIHFFDEGASVPGIYWDLVAAEGAIKFADVDSGTLPFVVRSGCATGSLIMWPDTAGNGNVGIGTGFTQPQFALHVQRTADTGTLARFQQTRPNKSVLVQFQNDAPASGFNSCGFDYLLNDAAGSKIASRIVCSLTDTTANAGTAAFQFQVLNNGVVGQAMKIQGKRVSIATNQSTDLLRVLNARCNGATWIDACSRELKQDVAPLSANEARATVAALNPVTYTYKHEPEEPRVGFIAEDAPERVSLSDGKSLCPMDLIAVLAKVVQEQERQIDERDEQLLALQARVAALEAAATAKSASDAAILTRLAALEVAGTP